MNDLDGALEAFGDLVMQRVVIVAWLVLLSRNIIRKVS